MAKERHATLVSAPPLDFGALADCNNPIYWQNGTMHVFTSYPTPEVGFIRHSGPGVENLYEGAHAAFTNEVNGDRWLEALVPAGDTLYGWYHNEPLGLCPGSKSIAHYGTYTAPRIGAVVSHDGGLTWDDLGFVLEAPPGSLDCGRVGNGFFAGGNGDFSVILDHEEEWLYFFYSAYAGAPQSQGVAVARMPWESRDDPSGAVKKWFGDDWSEPGVGGQLTPTFTPFVDWGLSECDSFWGPSVHWNTELQCYVMLLNRAQGHNWPQEGIYVSYSAELADPGGWSEPEKLLDGGGWYPQVVGLEAGGTDKLAGARARFFMTAKSEHEIVFSNASIES